MALDCPALSLISDGSEVLPDQPKGGRIAPSIWPNYSDRVAELLRNPGRVAPKNAPDGFLGQGSVLAPSVCRSLLTVHAVGLPSFSLHFSPLSNKITRKATVNNKNLPLQGCSLFPIKVPLYQGNISRKIIVGTFQIPSKGWKPIGQDLPSDLGSF